MDSSFNEMAVDNMSFYDDGVSMSVSGMLMQDPIEQQQHGQLQQEQLYFSASPPLASLLSPEGSPQRFRIVRNITPKQNHQNVHGNVQGGKLSLLSGSGNMASAAINSSKTIRTFNSLSSESMDTSMDDDYMDYFEMENLDSNVNEGLFGFPSNLNSLICGQIKNESPEEKTNRRLFAEEDSPVLNEIKTPEVQRNRPSVRRCLSLFEEETTPIQKKSALESQENAKLSTTPLNLATNTYARTSGNSSFKRPEAPGNFSPRQAKRYRFSDKENFGADSPTTFQNLREAKSPKPSTSSKPVLRKCMSMNDAEIMTALARSENSGEPQLIGDFSGPFVLPLIEGRHCDLKSISSHTLAQLINGGFSDKVASFQIIDCRYPYEYDGGHIRGAINLYTQEQIVKEFLNKQKTEENPKNESNLEAAGALHKKRHIIIFHCEFSSERGPKLSRFLRNNDRARNTSSYPALEYPEIYLLHNGYKEFFETHSELCDPASYRPMLEPSYNEAYRHFRAKSKSWNGGDAFGAAASSRKKLYTEGRSLLYRL